LKGVASFVAGDWGTSNLRLFLCDADGVSLDMLTGPGAAAAAGRFPQVLASMTARWNEVHGELPAILCGMVGSSFGWVHTPYVPCPANPEQIAQACVTLQPGTLDVPGLSCINLFKAPDFLRGEETQVLGALHLDERLRAGCRVICLPGTHTKWVVVQDGSVREFLTSPTGEIFAVLREHSVLIRGGTGSDTDMEAFQKGLERFHELPDTQVLHRLFESRSRQLSGELGPDAAAAHMSGMLVASDVHGALRALSGSLSTREVVLVGAPSLTRLYARACAQSGFATRSVDGTEASLQGLWHIRRRLSQRVQS